MDPYDAKVERNAKGGVIIHLGTDNECRWCGFPLMELGLTPLERSQHSSRCYTRWQDQRKGRPIRPDATLDNVTKKLTKKVEPQVQKSVVVPKKTATLTKSGFDLDRIRARLGR